MNFFTSASTDSLCAGRMNGTARSLFSLALERKKSSNKKQFSFPTKATPAARDCDVNASSCCEKGKMKKVPFEAKGAEDTDD